MNIYIHMHASIRFFFYALTHAHTHTHAFTQILVNDNAQSLTLTIRFECIKQPYSCEDVNVCVSICVSVYIFEMQLCVQCTRNKYDSTFFRLYISNICSYSPLLEHVYPIRLLSHALCCCVCISKCVATYVTANAKTLVEREENDKRKKKQTPFSPNGKHVNEKR